MYKLFLWVPVSALYVCLPYFIGIKMAEPRLFAENFEIKYDTIEFNSNGKRNWNFKNSGDSPLMIIDCKSSCGCLVPICPKEPILPGKEGTISAIYDTKRIGIFYKTITLITNEAEDQNIHVLKITGFVKSNDSKK